MGVTTKNGYVDKEHFANHGPDFPLFARIVNGELYAVAREDRAGAETFGKVSFLSREWLKNTAFAAKKSDADFFADKPNGLADTSLPGSAYVRTANTSTDGAFKSPTPDEPIVITVTTPTPSVTPPPVIPAAVAPAVPAVPVSGALPAGSVADAPGIEAIQKPGMSLTTKVLIGVVIAAVVGAIMYFVSKKK